MIINNPNCLLEGSNSQNLKAKRRKSAKAQNQLNRLKSMITTSQERATDKNTNLKNQRRSQVKDSQGTYRNENLTGNMNLNDQAYYSHDCRTNGK
jgi:hypothetical protein